MQVFGYILGAILITTMIGFVVWNVVDLVKKIKARKNKSNENENVIVDENDRKEN